jgi:hypothetical protein|tara:strand:- start:33 stop:1847 length:1815 start_codon:yes stop_codon:yes gene_type:complete
MFTFYQKKNKSIFDILLFIFSITLISLLFTGYKFGVGDQTSHFIYILKNINTDYFNVDPIFKDLLFFSPHEYFYKIIASFITANNFEVLIFLITFCTLLIINVILFYISRHFGLIDLYGLIFIALISTIELYDIGGGWISSYHFKPSLIGRIFCYGSILLALKNKIFFAYTFSIFGTFVHPSLNALSGLIVYIISIINDFESTKFSYFDYIKSFFIRKKSIFNLSKFFIFFIIIYLLWGNYEKFDIDVNQYLKILNWRIENNINFIKFDPLQNLIFIFSSIFFMCLIYYLKKQKILNNLFFNLYFVIYLSLLFIFFFSTLFIIFSDIKFFYQIYVFRLIFCIKLLLFLSITYYFQAKLKFDIKDLFSIIFLLSLSLLNNYTRIDVLIILLLIIIFFYYFDIYKYLSIICLALLIFLIFDLYKKSNQFQIISNKKIPLLYFAPSKNFYLKLIKKPLNEKIFIIKNFYNKNENSYTYRYYKDLIHISYFIKNNLSKNSLILAPPSISHKIRILSKGSFFVDRKVIPWDSLKMINWGQRINDIYDLTNNDIKFDDSEIMKNMYKNINDNKIDLLNKKYEISHSILFIETKTSKKIIYKNNELKIVEN